MVAKKIAKKITKIMSVLQEAEDKIRHYKEKLQNKSRNLQKLKEKNIEIEAKLNEKYQDQKCGITSLRDKCIKLQNKREKKNSHILAMRGEIGDMEEHRKNKTI